MCLFHYQQGLDYSSGHIKKYFLLPEDYYFVIKKLSNTL